MTPPISTVRLAAAAQAYIRLVCLENEEEEAILIQMEEQQRNGWLNREQESNEPLHSMLQISRLNVKKREAEREFAQLLCRLHPASDGGKKLAPEVEYSDAKAAAATADELNLESHGRCSRGSKAEHLFNLDELLAELGDVKEQIRKLRLDMASASEAKIRAEKEAEDSSTKARLYSRYVEDIKKQIAASNFDKARANAAQINAGKEFREIEARRDAQASRFSSSSERSKAIKDDLQREINYAKELQAKLATTTSDINILQNELKLIRAIDKRKQAAPGMKSPHRSSGQAELEAARRELARLKEEGFRLMAEMDAVREELSRTAKEKERSSCAKTEPNSTLEHLKQKLYRARFQLEAASSAEKRAAALVSNLSAALEQMRAEAVAAKRETELTYAETRAVRSETEENMSHVFFVGERIQLAMQEVQAAVALEAIAITKLRTVSESSSNKATEKLEYDSWLRQSNVAQEIRGQKVAAAEAWMDALANTGKAESGRRTRRLSSSKKGYLPRKAIKTRLPGHDSDKRNCKSLNLKAAIAVAPRRSITVSGVSAATRRAKMRRLSMSAAAREPIVVSSNTCLADRRKSIVQKLVRFLKGSGTAKKQQVR